jgi:hypothetical protein
MFNNEDQVQGMKGLKEAQEDIEDLDWDNGANESKEDIECSDRNRGINKSKASCLAKHQDVTVNTDFSNNEILLFTRENELSKSEINWLNSQKVRS